MRELVSNVVRILLVALCLSQAAWTQQGTQDAKAYDFWNSGIGPKSYQIAMSSEDRKQVMDLWDSIGADIEKDHRGLAGTYYKPGYDNGYFLRWSPRAGYVLIPYFDENLITDFTYGNATEASDSEVLFTPIRDLKGFRTMKKMTQRWTMLAGFFMPVDLVKEFGLFQAGLGSYNEFNGQCCEFRPDFLAQTADKDKKKTDGTIPSKYKKLLPKPINGEIVFLGKKKS